MRIEKNDGLFYFLLKLIELGGGEKLAEGHFQTVAELFDGRDGNFPPAWVEQTVHGRRGTPEMFASEFGVMPRSPHSPLMRCATASLTDILSPQ